MAHHANTCKNLIFWSSQEAPTMVVVNLNLVVHHPHISSYLQCIIVEIVSYPPSDNTSRSLTEKPKILVIVFRKSAYAVAIIF